MPEKQEDFSVLSGQHSLLTLLCVAIETGRQACQACQQTALSVVNITFAAANAAVTKPPCIACLLGRDRWNQSSPSSCVFDNSAPTHAGILETGACNLAFGAACDSTGTHKILQRLTQ